MSHPKNSVVLLCIKFTCPGCHASYIGKTDRNLSTRILEHSKPHTNSEIFNHINSCHNFQHIHDILNLPDLLSNHNPISLHDILLSNTIVLDSHKHWSVLLFKEALAIRRNFPSLNHGLKASKELVLFHWYFSVCLFYLFLCTPVFHSFFNPEL